MTEPEFHLAGIVRERGEYTDFTGPLSLIIQLLSRNRVDISDVSISEILEQYLTWLGEMAELDLEIASEFVAMASHLVYIKSKMLLGETEPREFTELMASLEKLRAPEIYQLIKPISELLGEMYYMGAGLNTKLPELIEPDNTYRYSHSPDDLVRAFEMILLRTFSPQQIISIVKHSAPAPIAYPLEMKLSEIMDKLSRNKRLDINEILRLCTGRSETVAAFLAVLELCSAGRAEIDEVYLVLPIIRENSRQQITE